jgi:hypothetical protein
MKNIHILPTDKPSRLLWSFEDRRYYSVKEEMFFKNQNELQNQNIYITSDEEIKEGDWYINTLDEVVRKNNTINHSYHKKIILTTDQDLIKDGLQAIDDEFLEWFVKNPSCEKVEFKSYKLHFGSTLYKIIIPKDEPKQHLVDMKNHEDSLWEDEPKQDEIMERFIANAKQETTLEEVIGIKSHNYSMQYVGTDKYTVSMLAIEFGYHLALEQQERSYSEEEVGEILYKAFGECGKHYSIMLDGAFIDRLFKQFKKK